MKTKLFIFLAFTLSISLAQDIAEYREYHEKAIQAYYAQDKAGWLENNQKALEVLPDCATNIYYAADAFAQNNQPDSALKYLEMAVEFGYGWNSDKDENFKSLNENPEFLKIMVRVKELRKPVNNSSIAFTIAENDLIPEGLAYDPVEECFYLSSLYKCKILKISKEGKVTEFKSEKQDGLRPVTGMKVDEKRRILWVCTEVSGLHYKDADESEIGWSGIFKYDLNSGELIKKYILMEKGVHHLFNDIVITKSGDVYFTDSEARKVFFINHEKDHPETFLENIGLGYPNGIALSADEKYIYVADSGPGINRINLKTKEISFLKTPQNATTIGIDGLYLYNNSLIAVQNGFGEASRVTRFFLNENGDEVIKQEILEMNNPHFIIPTTGAIAGDEFYYIANSQLASFHQDNSIFPDEKLKDVIILKVKL
ncbi:MAG: SMP-30/gluconolactonase/LRE family protein [Candidatus Marinimicrobia bacterium]|nr:SMP-30/gluconolactonase/LRE family protein [Candidatus Neomarinimicrobiota bacterium]